MSNVMGGETELAVGDTIQLDKGLHIVECVGKDTADCLPLDDKNKGKPRTVQTPFPRHLVISRGGKPALDKFLSQPPKPKPGHVLLEPGDRLVHMGGHCTVVSVLDKKCVIGNLDGREFYEDRLVNEYRLTDVCTHKPVRLNEAERAANLEQFLQQRKSPQPETEETSDQKPTKEQEDKVMAKKSKPANANRAKHVKNDGTKGKLGEWLGYSVCSVIRKLAQEGLTTGHISAIVAKAGFTAKPTTVSLNAVAGRAGKYKIADLTKQQVKDLSDSASEKE